MKFYSTFIAEASKRQHLKIYFVYFCLLYYLGNSQLYFLIVLDRYWSFRLFFYFSWSFMIDIDRSLTVFWSFLIVLDRFWSFLTEIDQIWLFFIFHDRSWSIKRWKELTKNRERFICMLQACKLKWENQTRIVVVMHEITFVFTIFATTEYRVRFKFLI